MICRSHKPAPDDWAADRFPGLIDADHTTGFVSILLRLDTRIITELMAATFEPMDLLFYGIAVYEGFTLSFPVLPKRRLLHGSQDPPIRPKAELAVLT